MNDFLRFFTASRKKIISLRRNLNTSALRLGFLDCSPNAQLDKNIAERFRCLPIPEPKTIVSYVWIDGTGLDLRMRTMTLNVVPSSHKECPIWSFDGKSANFSSKDKTENYMVPIAMYSDPFRRGNNKIVLCETFTQDKKPTKKNFRQACVEVLNRVCDHDILIGFEQEFYLKGPDGKPYGWPCGAIPRHDGKGYAAIGSHRIIGRDIAESVYRCSLYAGIDIFGAHAERGFSQWEVLTGPTSSMKAADDLWILRYIILMVAELFGIAASFKTKFVKHGAPSGLHTTMTTKGTRQEGGYKAIQDIMCKLEKTHSTDINSFDCAEGKCIKERLTGEYHTSKFEKFTYGVGDRTASVRIPIVVADKKKGFFEDRRPCSCADPYRVIKTLVNSSLC
ncbi:unnamed protein product [Ceutorhynchus assimilis]|uniref:glutamine synthetase n=1 Tax=Ceutorhynchus assimilis TaxID=467358 RepID=A0A9N9MNN0_9CUCU|nr:unnamed protein product [Ceutorhynchus assimilis]